MKKIDMSKFLKWIPVAVAGIVAVYQAVGEQKEADRIDDIEERIARLETDDEDIEEMEEA